MNKFLFVILAGLILFSSSTILPSQTFAFGPTCQYSSVSYGHPNQVDQGQSFAVSISLPTVCPQANNYHVMARFDVEDNMSRVLASNYTQYGFIPNNGQPFTFIVTNTLTAPSTPGPWRLQFIVYVFMSEDDADGLDYKVQSPQTVQVGQPSILFQTTSSTTTATSTSMVAPTTTANTTSSTEAQSIAQTIAPPSSSNELYEVIGGVIIIVAAIALFLLVGRKKHSKAE